MQGIFDSYNTKFSRTVLDSRKYVPKAATLIKCNFLTKKSLCGLVVKGAAYPLDSYVHSMNYTVAAQVYIQVAKIQHQMHVLGFIIWTWQEIALHGLAQI
jgi:hypothetical protein